MKKALVIIAIIALAIAAVAIFSGNKDATEPSQESSVGVSSITLVDTAASPASVGARAITWNSSAYPANLGVDINLIRKVSDSPAAYTLVREIAKDTPNDGNEIWMPASNEKGDDLYIEVTCASASERACRVTSQPMKAF